LCCGKPDSTDREISDKIQNRQEREEKKYKLLLLGAGESGKSTLLKQMRQIHGEPFDEEELKDSKDYIIQNIIEAMRILAIYSDLLADDEQKQTQVKEENEEIRTQVAMMGDRHPFGKDELDKFQRLWNDPGIRRTFDYRNKFQIIDTAEYLFDNMHKFADEDYIPTFDDYIRSRKRTTGVNKIRFDIKSDNGHTTEIYEVYDVGGQRNERRKWIHFFDGVAAIIFVSALSGYNLTLWEDARQNRMKEALALFKSIVNMECFKDTHMILFLNKSDLFDQIYRKDPISNYFKDYKGNPESKEEVIDYLQKKFCEQRKNKRKIIYSHVTCATDPDNVKRMFNCVRDIVVRTELGRAGLM